MEQETNQTTSKVLSLFKTIRQMMLSSATALSIGLAGLLSLSAPALAADNLPGKGITVTPIKSSIAEETFQTLLVARALEELGYTVKQIEIAEYVIGYQAVANGNVTYMATAWDPLHDNFYKGVEGETTLFREGIYSDAALQGYAIDKKTAEAYGITNIEDFKKPEIAALFDVDGDGKADLFGCTPGWGCEEAIEHHLDAYGLRSSINHKRGSYSALLAEVISRYEAGKPIFYYTWTPYWVSAVLVPGVDIVWIEVPFTSLPGDQAGVDTSWANGRNYGFPINTQRIIANKKFTDANPAAAKLFSIMSLPVADINLQNLRMNEGENQYRDIERHVEAWIKAHQETFDGWIEEAKKAAL